ncbi:MAG: alpha/beta fold hydrolase [Cyclobacteriaceae bacterium]
MPLISESGYRKRPWYYFSRHLETIVPSLSNKIGDVYYARERLELSDGDFLDLDWIKNGNKKLMIIGHGLEGSTDRHYIKRPAKFFSERQWDILAWNSRGCGGEINRLARSYHHGDTEDLAAVVAHALNKTEYESLVLLGISMGGCQAVKYFGESDSDDRLLGAFTVSVSCSLSDTSIAAEQNLGGFYGKVFLNKLKKKIAAKSEAHPELRAIDLRAINSFDDFHNQFTLRLLDYENVEDFYQKSSCGNYLEGISKPVFILNAQNDPMLGPGCFPFEQIKDHPYVYMETPKYGGHVGFTIPGQKYSYIELSAEKFFDEIIFQQEPSQT